MRFITEFELHPDVIETTRSYRNYTSEKMNILEKRLAEQIAISFHWDVPEKMEAGKYKLEIEAFPMGKWIEFKEKLKIEIRSPAQNNNLILRMIEELESFGKPSGDTITNHK